MIKYLLFLLVFTSPVTSMAQIVAEWTQGGMADEFDRLMSVDRDGSVYVSGKFEGTINLFPSTSDYILTSIGGYDTYLMKLDKNGNILWVLQSNCVEDDGPGKPFIDSDGNILLVGFFSGTMSFSNSQTISASDNWETYMIKLDGDGQVIWAKSTSFSVNQLAYDEIDNIYLVGGYSDSVDLDPGLGEYWSYVSGTESERYISKLNPSGDLIWTEVFEGDSSGFGVNSMKINSQGEICIAGVFTDVVDFDPGPGQSVLVNGVHPDMFFLKLDALGQFLWVKTIGNANEDDAKDMVLDDEDNWFITGDFFRYNTTATDFNPGPGYYGMTSLGGWDSFILKLDSDGNFQWAKKFGSVDHERGLGIAVDTLGNVYGTGMYSNTIDFDPGPGTFNLTENEVISIYYDAYIVKLDTDGNFVWAESVVSNAGEYIGIDEEMSVYLAGRYGYFSEPVNPSPNSVNISIPIAGGGVDKYTVKFRQSGVVGRLYFDADADCTLDTIEYGLANRLAIIEPGGIIVETNGQGIWHVDDLPIGNYTISFDTASGWIPTCSGSAQFNVTSTSIATAVAPIGLINSSPCAKPTVSVFAPFLRRCFSGQKIYVQTCNSLLASEALVNSYVDVEISPYMIPEASSLPYVDIGNNLLRIETGDLQPGECLNFWVSTQISCDAGLNHSLCLQANVYPLDSCMLDTIPALLPADFVPCSLPWDGSRLELEGWCDSDSIRFSISNIGEPGTDDMQCFSPYRLFIDGHYILLDSVLLAGGATYSLAFLADGRTWRLEVDQHPLHPGSSNPSTTVELCNNSGGWTPHLVATLPQNDFNPMVDIYCGAVSGSYDPNDKTGYPLGVGAAHLVEPNGKLDYVIRFQNTGTDTAFTVVIRDTLDTDLDIFSIVSGVSSHPYDFRIYGPRIAEWTFSNILLPDSATDLNGSQGFVCFKANQQPDLTPGTEIVNTADIYFDFNDPVITNTTSHVIANEPGSTELDSVSISGCQAIEFHGQVYDSSGTYFHIIQSETDTVVVLTTTIINSNASIIENNGMLSVEYPDGASNFQWLNCDNSYLSISGENDSLYFPSGSGSYAVEIEFAGCIDTSNCINMVLVDVTDTNSIIGARDISAYPNPTNDWVNIDLKVEIDLILLNLYDLQGKQIQATQLGSSRLISIKLPESSGIYYLQIVDSEGNVKNLKLVKQ